MKKSFLLSIFAIATLASCQKDADIAVGGQTVEATFEATILTNATRTTAEVGDGVVSVLWAEDDAISMFAKGTTNSELTLEGEGGTTTGSFTGTITEGDSGSYIAYYPYAAANALNDTTLNVTLPAEQTYVEGSLASAPMLAVSQTKSLAFENLAALVRIVLKSEDNHEITSVALRGNAGEALAGAATVDVSAGTLALAQDAEATTLTLDCGEGITLSAEGTSFYFVVPAMTLANGFTIVATCADGDVMTKSTNDNVTLEAAKVYDYAAIEFEANTTIATNANFATVLAAAEEGEVIMFGEDITTAERLNITPEDITIDLNGNEWTFDIANYGIVNSGTLTLVNGNINFNSSADSTAAIANKGTLKLNYVNIDSNQSCVTNLGVWDYNQPLENQVTPTVKWDIVGGTFTSTWTHPQDHPNHAYAINCIDNAVITITDATVEGDGGIYVSCAYADLKNVASSKNCTSGGRGLYICCSTVDYDSNENISDIFVDTNTEWASTYGKTIVNEQEYTTQTVLK